MSHTIEGKDKALFDRISSLYVKKDEVDSSRIARSFQLMSLVNLMTARKNHFGKVLELGCGAGASAEYMKGLFDHYLGVDYSQNLIDLAKKKYASERIQFECMNIKHLAAETRFDMILGVGVLHHVDDCHEVLTALKRFTKPDTLIGFIEPQRGNPLVQLMRGIRKITDKGYSEDQRFFSKSEVVEIFQTAGFTVETIRYQGYFSPPLAQVIINPQVVFRPLSKALTKIDSFIQKFLNNRLSWNLVVVAKVAEAHEKVS